MLSGNTGTMMKNTFTGTQQEFPNMVLHAFISEIIETRQQISISGEANKLRGWEDPLNEWMKNQFAVMTGDLDRMYALSMESVPMSSLFAHNTIAQDLTGRSKNLRQPTQRAIRNSGLRVITTILDQMVVAMSHFDSRWVQCGLNIMERDQAEAFLTRCHGICVTHGGRANLRPLISGALPEDMDDGFNYDGRWDTDLGSSDVGGMQLADGTRVSGRGNQESGLQQEYFASASTEAPVGGARTPGASVAPVVAPVVVRPPLPPVPPR